MRNNTRWIIASLILATGGEIPANEPKVKFVPNPLYDVADSVQVGGYLHPGPTGDPVVATIIRKWQRENSQIDRFTAEFSLLRYDAVWKEVKIGRGSYGVDCYRRWFIRIVPTDVTGWRRREEYTWKPSDHEMWWCGPGRLLKINEPAKQYEELSLPINLSMVSHLDNPVRFHAPLSPPPPPLPVIVSSEADESENLSWLLTQLFWNCLLDGGDAKLARRTTTPWRWILTDFATEGIIPRVFLIRRPLAELTAQYDVSLVKQTSAEIQLQCLPWDQNRSIKKILVLLDSRSFRIKAIKLFDNGSDKSTVYVFERIHLNHKHPNEHSDLDGPNLTGYKRILPPGD